tara:strand:+ start:448 stop:1215 length:768 start_codon:yes stop_codon:yes gene_type:complete
MKCEEPNYLFTIGADAKTVKGEKHNYSTAIQYMLPHKEVYEHPKFAKLLRKHGIKDYNACLWAGNCMGPCLNKSGHGAMKPAQVARGKRTVFKLLEREAYESKAMLEVLDHVAKAKRKDMTPCVRPNGTTDEDYGWLIDIFPSIQFYDYTKSEKRMMSNKRDNYHLTFSYDGTPYNWTQCKRVINKGHNVAICIGGERDAWPKEIYNRPVIDGDNLHGDLRFLDPKGKRGVFVGLSPKGKAKKCDNGFVFQPVNN